MTISRCIYLKDLVQKEVKTVQDSLDNLNMNNKLQAVFAVVLQDEQSLRFYHVGRMPILAIAHSIHMHNLQHPYPLPHCFCHIYLWLGVEELSHC